MPAAPGSVAYHHFAYIDKSPSACEESLRLYELPSGHVLDLALLARIKPVIRRSARLPTSRLNILVSRCNEEKTGYGTGRTVLNDEV